ncbi:MAG: hypothetical protein J5819_05840, partial [Eubacterium sp.]|nr:hypothetical protein [Eubacterium sp.]
EELRLTHRRTERPSLRQKLQERGCLSHENKKQYYRTSDFCGRFDGSAAFSHDTGRPCGNRSR